MSKNDGRRGIYCGGSAKIRYIFRGRRSTRDMFFISHYNTLQLTLTTYNYLQLHYTTHTTASSCGEVTTATIATTPQDPTPTTFRSISGFALPSTSHNNQAFLYRFPIIETSATALCVTTGIYYIYLYIYNIYNIYMDYHSVMLMLDFLLR